MFMGTASEIWRQLEKRFSLNDGSRKYKLNKDTYDITQSGSSVDEYYTKMKCVWEELDNINVLLVLAVVTPKISVFLGALNKQKEEQRLFQFLNEVSQRLLFKSSANIESSALLSKGVVKDKCSICVFNWHPPEKCWEKKSKAFMALKSFFKFVAIQFEKQVKIVRSDNALEFVKGQCGPYLESLGIVHQTSCVDRPQQNELKALDDNGSWELTSLPTGKKAIGLHWIYKTKHKADGNVERKKARLVVNGNNQRHEVYIKPEAWSTRSPQAIDTNSLHSPSMWSHLDMPKLSQSFFSHLADYRSNIVLPQVS
nr:cysteine-rich RLK (receptor-like protein kinase) 8 [Tanacetum cinerariifolium]